MLKLPAELTHREATADEQPILVTVRDDNPNAAAVRFLVDGAPVPADAAAYERIGRPVPTCLERDFNIPDLAALSAEVGHIARLQSQAAGRQRQVA